MEIRGQRERESVCRGGGCRGGVIELNCCHIVLFGFQVGAMVTARKGQQRTG